MLGGITLAGVRPPEAVVEGTEVRGARLLTETEELAFYRDRERDDLRYSQFLAGQTVGSLLGAQAKGLAQGVIAAQDAIATQLDPKAAARARKERDKSLPKKAPPAPKKASAVWDPDFIEGLSRYLPGGIDPSTGGF